MNESTACNPIHFLVPIFGGALTNETSEDMATYAPKSDQAHIVLGSMIFAMVFVWCLYVFGYTTKVTKVLFLSGLIQVSMGVYLFTWVFVLLHPSDLSALYQYSSRDLLQLQHMSISSVLIAAGFVEICYRGLNFFTKS